MAVKAKTVAVPTNVMTDLITWAALTQRPRFVRPRCTAGDGTTSLVPVLIIGR